MMTVDLKMIYETESLTALETYLQKADKEETREVLLSQFKKYADYKNVSDWNKAVRLCECLAITGWGKYEPLHALRTNFFNGNPMTCFVDKYRKTHFVDAIWSKRKNGYTMEQGRATYCHSPLIPDKPTTNEHPVIEDIQDLKLSSQSNWIPKSPILVTRAIGNCYESTRKVIESIDNDLQSELDQNMRPELYGRAIDRIIINCGYSYYDHDHCKTNYVIVDERLRLKNKDFYPALMQMYSKKEIEDNGYFLRNRYEYGAFRNGVMRVQICFEKTLSELPPSEQKEKIGGHVAEALENVVARMKNKNLDYDFYLMMADFRHILNKWKKGSI